MARLSRTARTRAPREERLDAVFHALSDRTRRALLARLRTRPAMITELAKPFAMSLPALSRHIRVLESAGLIERTIAGRVHECALNATPLKSIEAWISHYTPFWEGTLDSLARHVETPGTTTDR
jgi:DNA-binding transcriptional ArsR family regulator